jgi:hypothetical protein
MNKTMHLLVLTIALFYAGAVMAIEEPKYQVIEQAEPFELRAYQPRIVAETIVSGDMDEASSTGFKIIADYIFGNNTATAGGNEKISMTAPVTIEVEQPRASSETISMTEPVTVAEKDGQWRMRFVMPSQYTIETLPTPNNDLVSLHALPAQNYAVIRFSWLVSEEKVAAKTAELMAWLATKSIKPIGKPQLARYNPPWTLPFLRRNEVMVAIDRVTDK